MTNASGGPGFGTPGNQPGAGGTPDQPGPDFAEEPVTHDCGYAHGADELCPTSGPTEDDGNV